MGTGGNNVPLVASGSTVRRLSPIEVERLQGFPDEWTRYRLNAKGEVIEQYDWARYRQCGNAVAVPVVQWLMSRLVSVETKTTTN